ncbi:MAG TPA: response regulator, partial [Myxococcales bacterium LLY-WYZ-16_1]|nr:response regulator [Myxococcales bacterium LLY-WYZ-16_1]
MSHRILVVDDEASIRSLLEDFFEEHGFQVASAGDADEAEHILGRRRCHLAIIDFLLPRRNGFAVAEAIRHHPDRASTPLILISGVFKNPKTAVEAREKYGVEAFLSKPLDLDRLLDTVRQALAGIPADAEADEPPPVVSRSMDVVPPAPRAAGSHSVERAGDVPPPRGLSYGPREGRGRSGPSAAVRASPSSSSSS